MTELQTRPGGDVLEAVVAQGDLSKLTNEQRVMYYLKVCDSLGLNPATRPFEFIVLNGRMVLYARKEASDQLRQSRDVSVVISSRVKEDDLYIVTAHATMGYRTDESIGAVSIKGLQGDALANALMKAETKAKRRVTLSICGLGWSDESEVETIPGARQVTVDSTTGEIKQDTPQIEAPKGEAHWSTDTATRKAFWAWCTSQGLNTAEVHAICKVAHLAEITVSEADTRKLILDFIAQRTKSA
jgi:hypothetical protein